MIKDQINFVPGRNEGIKNGEARREQRDSGGHDEFVCGDERGQCNHCPEVIRLDVKRNLLERLPIL